MAEPAFKLDEADASARLRQSRVATQRNVRPKTSGRVLHFPNQPTAPANNVEHFKNTRPVSEFPGGHTIGRSSIPSSGGTAGYRPVREEELYNGPRNKKQERARIAEQQRKEQENKRRWLKNKLETRERLQDFIRPPQATEELPESVRSSVEFQQAQQEFEEQSIAIIEADRAQASATRDRLRTLRQLAEQKRKLVEQAKKIKEAIEKVKKAKDVAWTAYGVGSLAETEGAAAETINVTGILIDIYRGMKTVLMPQAQVSDDPDAGQFFRGFLSFAEPTALRGKDITAWLAGMHAIYGYFLLFVILLFVLLLMTAFGLGFYILTEILQILPIG